MTNTFKSKAPKRSIPATNLKALCKTMPMDDVTRRMGVAYSSLARYKSMDLAPPVVEKLAGMLLEKRGGKDRTATNLVVAKIPGNQLEMITAMFKGLNIQYRHFKD